jgi:predicted nucleic acid-binding Zn ribbon protein
MDENLNEGRYQVSGHKYDCPVCSETVSANDAFCEYCGYPLKGSEEARNSFRHNRRMNETKLEDTERKIKTASLTLYILAGLSAIWGIILASKSENPGAIILIDIILSSIYAGLGYWCRIQPIAAIICGLILYVTVSIINTSLDTLDWKSVLISLLVIAFLGNGLYSAFEAERIKKELHIV